MACLQVALLLMLLCRINAVPVVVVSNMESRYITTSVGAELRTVILMSVDASVRWKTGYCRNAGMITMLSLFNNPRGFNERKSSIFVAEAILCSSINISIQLQFDPFYRVPPDGDRIVVTIDPSLTTSGTLSLNDGDLVYTIRPSPSSSSEASRRLWSVMYFTDQRTVDGCRTARVRSGYGRDAARKLFPLYGSV